MNPRIFLVLLLVLQMILGGGGLHASPPIALNPTNPHYFLFRGQPTVLVASTEHYGSVVNLDFDYVTYLNEIAAKNLNYTRMFAGSYVEYQGWFGIPQNTLAPASGRFIAPWIRSSTPGYTNGGNKFDLSQFDPAYFARLQDFVSQASSRGIVVEVSLFCNYYTTQLWQLSPLYQGNNINGINGGGGDGATAYSLGNNGNLEPIQDAYVQQVVTALNGYDNVIYEICNELYDPGTYPWQQHISGLITQTEASLPNKHLISQNMANGSSVITNPDPKVSIFNYHYATPNVPGLNASLPDVIGFDEDGTSGNEDITYRHQGWEFLMSGGGLFDNLDYSFTVGSPTGAVNLPDAPSGGDPNLRTQLGIMRSFFSSIDFLHMSQDTSTITGGVLSGATTYMLSEPGKQYAVFLEGPGGNNQASLVANLPAATYTAEWVNTQTGNVDKSETFTHPGGSRTLTSPTYLDDIAVRITDTSNPVNVIFDTDMSSDCDDVGALAILNKLADGNEAKILACVSNGNDSNKAIAASIDTINTYYGRTNIPIGTYQGSSPQPAVNSNYTGYLRDHFPHTALADNLEPSALSVYRSTLASAANGSVTIVSVGFLLNLEDLLKSPADSYSSLSGAALVAQKVKNLVVMGGGYPSNYGEYNFTGNGSEGTHTQYVINNWPTTVPILFSGAEIGQTYTTGNLLDSSVPVVDPVRDAYDIYTGGGGRYSWDLTAVLAAVRNPSTYWSISGVGSNVVQSSGANSWDSTTNRNQTYLILKSPDPGVATVLNNLLDAAPGSALAPVINSSYNASGTVGTAFSYQISASNSPTSYNATGLPAGLSVNANTGLINGTPTTAGTTNFTISATNATGTGTAILTLIVSSNLPSPWVTQDIGAVGISGYASYSGGTFTVAGGGADIWGTTDAFFYVYQMASGDCSITARVATQTNSNASAKAAVMIRSDLTPGSAQAMIDVSPSGVEFICRTSAGANAIRPNAISGVAPYWVRMTRAGNLFTACASPDGTTWTQVGTQTIAMGTSVYIGMPVCSHVAGTLTTATIDNVTVTGGVPVITSSVTAVETAGTDFNYQVTATNSPTSYSATGLPAGLMIGTTTGTITGTATVTGTFPVQISATSAAGTDTITLTITLNPAAPSTDTPTLPQWGLYLLALLLLAVAGKSLPAKKVTV